MTQMLSRASASGREVRALNKEVARWEESLSYAVPIENRMLRAIFLLAGI